VRLRGLPGPFGETFLTDAFSALATRLPERDVYVTENDAVLYAAPFLKRRHPDATVIHLAASDRLLDYAFSPRPDDTRLRAAKRRANRRVDTALLQRLLVRSCDGVIAMSGVSRDRVRAFAGSSLPLQVANPYVQPAAYSALESIEPDLESNVAVTVGEWCDHKGADLLVDAWPTVRGRHPDAELRLVGRGFPGA
jgi:glycosyltransferase involved in cell wall biosynthesis